MEKESGFRDICRGPGAEADPLLACHEDLSTAARVALEDVLALQKGERLLIIANPAPGLDRIARSLYNQARELGGNPSLIYQEARGPQDEAERAVIAALATEPDIFISLSSGSLGRDPRGSVIPYTVKGELLKARNFDHITAYLLQGKGCSRAFWCPGITPETFVQSVLTDYDTLRQECRLVADYLDRAQLARITSPLGTDLSLDLRGRKAQVEDGNFRRPGLGGNLPAGEVHIGPVPGTAQGRIVLDGGILLEGTGRMPDAPLVMDFQEGFLRDIRVREEGLTMDRGVEVSRALVQELTQTLLGAETRAMELEKAGKLPRGLGELYHRNSRALGLLGLGLNGGLVSAAPGGLGLSASKARGACTLALGANRDQDAPALVHIPGILGQATVELQMKDGHWFTLLEKGQWTQLHQEA